MPIFVLPDLCGVRTHPSMSQQFINIITQQTNVGPELSINTQLTYDHLTAIRAIYGLIVLTTGKHVITL